MPTIGIISVQKKRKPFCKRIFNKAEITEIFGDNPTYIVSEVCANADDIEKMSHHRLKKLIKNSARLLTSAGAECILFSKELKALTNQKYTYNADTDYKIPIHRLPDAFRFAVNLNSKNRIFDTVAIIDSSLLLVDFNFLSELCNIAKKIVVFTDNTHTVEDIIEKIYQRYGAYIEISRPESCKKRIFNALIDVNSCLVRVNDLIIDKAVFNSKSSIYETDAAEEAAFLKEYNFLEIKNWISGKNIIKIS